MQVEEALHNFSQHDFIVAFSQNLFPFYRVIRLIFQLLDNGGLIFKYIQKLRKIKRNGAERDALVNQIVDLVISLLVFVWRNCFERGVNRNQMNTAVVKYQHHISEHFSPSHTQLQATLTVVCGAQKKPKRAHRSGRFRRTLP